MNIRASLIISFFALLLPLRSQTITGNHVPAVYKINDLLKRIDTSQTTLIINFWATWCKPCIQELPVFDSLTLLSKNYKVILVSLDFKEDKEKKVDSFLQKNKIISECILLDEINGNDYIDKISKEWSGAIPATLIVNKNKKVFIEKKVKLAELLAKLTEF
jgi:thiol-disulfide isomerase/thioredoxin